MCDANKAFNPSKLLARYSYIYAYPIRCLLCDASFTSVRLSDAVRTRTIIITTYAFLFSAFPVKTSEKCLFVKRLKPFLSSFLRVLFFIFTKANIAINFFFSAMHETCLRVDGVKVDECARQSKWINV